MTKALIVGDVHLGKGLNIGKPGIGTSLNSRVIDQVKLLDWVVERGLEFNVELIVLTGDIWEDVKPHYALVNLFIKFLKKCEVNNIEVHIVIGNHDIKRSGSNYSSPLDLIETAELSNTFVYKNINTVHKKGVSFTLMPYRDRRSLNSDKNIDALKILCDQLTYEAASIPLDCDSVLVGHLALEGSLFVGDEFDNYANELMCPLGMFNNYDYVWMGHVHRPQVRCREPYVSHIGSLDISDFGETNHTKIVVFYDSEMPNKFKEIDVPSRPLRKLLLEVPEDFESTEYVIEQINQIHEAVSFKNAIVRVDIKLLDPASKNVDREKIEKLLFDLGAFYICSFSESKNILVVPVDKQTVKDNTINPKAAIKLYADQVKFLTQNDKNKFVTISNDIVDDYFLSLSK